MKKGHFVFVWLCIAYTCVSFQGTGGGIITGQWFQN